MLAINHNNDLTKYLGITTQSIYSTILGSKAISMLSKLCYVENKMYRLYRKIEFYIASFCCVVFN